MATPSISKCRSCGVEEAFVEGGFCPTCDWCNAWTAGDEPLLPDSFLGQIIVISALTLILTTLIISIVTVGTWLII